MPTIVELPDKTELEFPDGMDEPSMQQAISKFFPQFAKTEPAPTPAHTPTISPTAQLAKSRLAFAPLAGQALANLPDQPLITLPEWPKGEGSLEEQITGQVYSKLKDFLGFMTSPKGAAVTGAAIAAPEVAGPIISAAMLPAAVEEGIGTVKSIGKGDIPGAAGHATGLALTGAGVLGGVAQFLPRTVAEARVPMEVPRAPEPITIPQPAYSGPTPPKISAVEQAARRAEIKAARPVVPETLPEPERGMTILDEIRAAGADTKAKIQKLFPQLSRETAAKLRDQAFPREKQPDNISRAEVDRLFLDKLNEESNREIEAASAPAKPAPAPETPSATSAPEAKAPEPTPPAKVEVPAAKEPTFEGMIKDAKTPEDYAQTKGVIENSKNLTIPQKQDYLRRLDEEHPDLARKPAAKPAAETGKEIPVSPSGVIAARPEMEGGVSKSLTGKPWSVPWADGRARAWFKTKESANEFYRQKAREGDVDGPPTQEVEPTQGVKYADEKYPPKSKQERTIIELEDQLKSIKQQRREVRAKYKGVRPVSTMNRTTPNIERGQAFQRELDNLEIEETGVARQLQQLKQQPNPPEALAKPTAKPAAETEPVAAAAKVEQQVKTVAKTEGQRSAKEVKSELVQKLEDAAKESPFNTADYFDGLYVYEARTLSETTRLTDRPVEGTVPLKDWLDRPMTKKDKTPNRDTGMGGRFMQEALERKKVPKITIEIPGDGTFTVWNTKDALGGLADRARKISTSTAGPKGFSESKPTREQGKLWAEEAKVPEPELPETPPTGPGMADLGAATPSSIPDAPSNFRHWWDVNVGRPAAKVVPTVKALWNGHEIRERMAYLKDWVDNSSKRFARMTANDIRQPLRRLAKKDFAVADNALSMVIEAKGDPAALDAMRMKLIDSTKADPWWRKQALDALDYATYHWDDLSNLAEKYKGITRTQVDVENASNIPTLRREGYVPHRQEIDEMDLLTSAGQGQSTFFEKPRAYDTFADSIAAGVDPKKLSATDLLENRLSSGMRLVNSRKWMDTLRGWKDPTTGAPVATNLKALKRADGSTVMVPPPGYVSEMVGPHSVAILKGYEGTFNALTDPSFFTKNMAGRAFMQANATGKSINLLIDTFHLGRLAFWDSLIKALGVRTFKAPFPSFRKGLTMLDFTEGQIREMAANGEIPQRWLGTMLEDKRRLDLAVKSGYNVGRISDALYQDLIHNLPVVGQFNKWLFDQFQRGAMAESWLLEFERARRASPKISEEAIAREVTKDLNVRFGNLGRQGIFKSRTAQDAARVLFLAPQWNEGLIRSELGAVKEAGQFAMDAATGKRIYAGTLLRSVGAMALMQFAANQIINQVTRGKFTWENEEEGWGSKLSAWVPDIAGNGPGFFLHPLGLAAETTHLLTNLFERSGGDTSKVVLDYARSRSSAAMRPILTLLTRTDFLGRHIKPDNLWGEVVKSAIPTPIAGQAVTAMGKQMVTGEPSEQFSGQFQKQAMQSMGIRTEGAPSPEQRISRLAQEWRREKGVPQNFMTLGVGDYQPLVQAVRVGNKSAANAEIDRLREKHTDEEIQKHFRQWQKAPFTGSHAREREFRSGLTPVQDIAYIKARDDRERIASEIRSLLR